MFRVSFVIVICLALVGYATAANILSDPSFESGTPATDHWQPWGTWGFTGIWSTDAHSGLLSGRMTQLHGNETNCWILLQHIPGIDQTKQYNFSVYVKMNNFNGGYARVHIPWFDASNGWLGNSQVNGTFTGTTGWTLLSGTVTPMAGAVSVGEIQLSYTTNGGPTPTGDLFFDDASMEMEVFCSDRPQMDTNGDCKVDFADFAVLVSEWLYCGYSDLNLCS